MRPDRFFLCLVRPFRPGSAGFAFRSMSAIADEPETVTPYYARPPAGNFSATATVKSAGYQGVDLKAGLEAPRGKKENCRVTFDDGYATFTTAFPIPKTLSPPPCFFHRFHRQSTPRVQITRLPDLGGSERGTRPACIWLAHRHARSLSGVAPNQGRCTTRKRVKTAWVQPPVLSLSVRVSRNQKPW